MRVNIDAIAFASGALRGGGTRRECEPCSARLKQIAPLDGAVL